ncbi:trafficking protein particle complex subunit 10 [Lingula anatina]|uniref:Trafficking protein particle complex subunit 10 n=1 Tax=Lingula anatina TaxID=7574 RepID=A0A1S3J6I8_LINAN|nr:trafficking protein particle complex subunit 10 [Lingula anatina]|eukprot:XP_013406005.1 trafficking protein particle complex subunit 10 [Lingula anatina]
MEKRPIITCYGDQTLYSSLCPAVTEMLPRAAVEWRRSYGRPARKVCVEATFVPFDAEIFKAKEADDFCQLTSLPYFHLYWTDCDLDTYKSSIRDHISTWLSILRNYGISDWMIVVVTHDEKSVKSKLLPRTNVYDKVKNDFCGKYADRCVMLAEPLKSDPRSSESWNNFLNKFRVQILESFNISLNKFEEKLRSQRELRTQAGWDFCQYFLMQEELAFMFEMLGVYEDALIQYDELDALFSQFLLNHAAGATAEWITNLTKPCEHWEGLNLSRPVDKEKRYQIQLNKITLLDLRSYLFSRQCALLFLLYRPWEVAQRSMGFMQTCVQDVELLEVHTPPGSLACWVFLSCMETLQACEKFSQSGQVATYSLHTASLWDYTRKKLYELGELCGLLPGMTPSSEQLHLVVDLVAGMRILEQREGESPKSKLQEALSSQTAFQKNYLELSELAMGTFKHIGRMRSAKRIGQDLADFYMGLGEYSKAEGFLLDALKMYKRERWTSIADHIRVKVAQCQEREGSISKYLRSCVCIASSQDLDDDLRMDYYRKLLKLTTDVSDGPYTLKAYPLLTFDKPLLDKQVCIIGDHITITLGVTNHLPGPITCNMLSIALEPSGSRALHGHHHVRHHSGTSSSSMELCLDTTKYKVFEEYEYTSNGQVQTIRLQCHDASTMDKQIGLNHSGTQKDVQLDDYTISASLEHVVMMPGHNTFSLSTKLDDLGSYCLSQLCAEACQIQLVESLQELLIEFQVKADASTVCLKSPSGQVLAGFVQELELIVNPGSYTIPEGAVLHVSSQTLQIFQDEGQNKLTSVTLPALKAYETWEQKIFVKAALGSVDEEEHLVDVEGDWNNSILCQSLTFQQPFCFKCKMRNTISKRFVELTMTATRTLSITVNHTSLKIQGVADENIVPFYTDAPMVLTANQSATYLWQLKEIPANMQTLSCSLVLGLQDPTGIQCNADYNFKLENEEMRYGMLTSIRSDSEGPVKSGGTCTLNVDIQELGNAHQAEQLTYQIEVDKKCWVVMGKTAGEIGLQNGRGHMSLKVVPLQCGYIPVPSIKISDAGNPGEFSERKSHHVFDASAAQCVTVEMS